MATTPAAHKSRRRTAALLAAACALLLSGCLRMDLDITLSEEDTATGTFVFAVSDQLAEAIGMDPQELWQEGADDLRSDLPEGATEEPYAADGYTGARYTFAEEPIETFSDDEEEFSIRRDGDEYVVTGSFDLTDEEGEVPQEMRDVFDVRIAVTFPGEVIETTGTVEGNTVVWRPPFGQRTKLSARGSAVAGGAGGAGQDATAGSTEGTDGTSGDAVPDDADAADDAGAGFPWWTVALAAAALLLLALVAWLIVRANRPRASEAPSGPAYAPPPYGPPPSAQPPYGPPPPEPGPDPGAPPPGAPRPPAHPQ